MNDRTRHRFLVKIIRHAVSLYYRFNISGRDVEDLLAERGITVSYETIRLWFIRFGAKYVRRLKRSHRIYSDRLYIDEVFVKINSKQCKYHQISSIHNLMIRHKASNLVQGLKPRS